MTRLELKDTVELMGSSDYRDRFVAEYIQLKIRYEKLKAFNTKIEAARRTDGQDNGVDEPIHDCPAGLLREQQAAMGELLHILEVRAAIEDIDLSDAMMYLENKKVKEAAGEGSRPTKDPEIEKLKLKLEEYESDWEIVKEAIGRVLEKGLFDDADDEKIFAASLNVLYKIKKLEEPEKMQNAECRMENCTSSVGQCPTPSPAGEGSKICSDCVHLPICEYCAGHLKDFTLPCDRSCGMYLRVREAK